MEIQISMQVVDCQQYTKGEEQGINDIEFSMSALDDCQEYSVTLRRAFDGMCCSIL